MAQALSKQGRSTSVLDPVCHPAHIYNHIQELLRLYDKQKIVRFLEECGLQLQNGSVCRNDGCAITGVDCQSYLKAVRRFISYVDFVLARISMVQAGCPTQRDDMLKGSFR